MKFEVKITFQDKYTGKMYTAGEKLVVDKKRGKELVDTKYVQLLEVVKLSSAEIKVKKDAEAKAKADLEAKEEADEKAKEEAEKNKTNAKK